MNRSNHISRRTFCKALSCSMCTLGLSSATGFIPAAYAGWKSPPPPDDKKFLKEVPFYKKLSGDKIECGICPKKCQIADFERGYCGNKENRGGTYYSLVYARPCALHVDPIEKKPLYHHLPGTKAYSIAAAGCNFECRFCQNWRIAQYRPEQIDSGHLPPENLARDAASRQAETIAYTYSEPVVFYEYMYDCAKAGRAKGIGSVMISNGYILEEPLRKLCKQLTGVKIDLKAFTDTFYREQCSGELEPVLHTLKVLKNIGIWFEIVVLIIPTLNDSPGEIKRMCDWIHANLGPDVPIHFSRFHPMYKIKNLPRTPVSTLEMCWKTAKSAGLHYPYLGNVTGHEAENTFCPKCSNKVLHRMGYAIIENKIKDQKCIYCGNPIPGVWKQPL